jgi:PAS domain S-box-containing protein
MITSKTSMRFSIGICGLHEPMRSDLIAIASQLGGEVRAAASSDELTAWLQTQAVDAALVDDELLASDAALQACIRRAATPTIAFTHQLERTERALAFGAADVFSYRLNRDLLARRLENNIIAYRARRQMNTYRGRFEALYDLAPVMMHVLSEEGVLLRANQAWLRTLGYRAEDVEGRPYAELLTDDLRADFPACHADVFAQGYARDVRTRLVGADGVVHHLIVDSNIFLDASGERVVVSMLRDVTDIQRSEDRLKESNRLYQAIFEEANDGILLVDLETKCIIEANPAAGRLLGCAQEELLGRSIVELEENNEFVWMFEKRPEGRQTVLDDLMLRRKDGTRVPVEAHSRLIQLEGRSAVLAVLRNISTRYLLLQKEKSTRLLAETLRDSADAFIRADTVQEVLDIAIAMVRRVVPGPAANVAQLQGDSVRLLRWVGYDQVGFCNEDIAALHIDITNAEHYTEMVTTRRPVYLPDVVQAGWPNAKTVTSGWIRSYVGVPLLLGDKIYGFLNVDSPAPHAFTSEHVESIEVFAHQASIALERATLLEELRAAKASLEHTVAERTAALVQANRSLRTYIDELRTTQETLSHERSLLQKIINSVSDMIYVKDREERYVLANQATLIALGAHSLEEVVGRTAADFFDEHYAALHHEIDVTIMTTGQPLLNYNNTMRYADGTIHRQLLSKYPLYDVHGEVVGLVGINRDVTEIELIEAHLREEREQLAQVLRSARCLLWTASVVQQGDELAWHFQIINEDAAQELLPLKLDGCRYSERWTESILPEDAQRRDCTLRTHVAFSRHSFNHEIRCRAADGSLMWLAEDVIIKRLDDHTYRLVGVCTDITERKASEEALQNAYDDLERRIQERMAELIAVNDALRAEVAERQRAEDAERRQRLLAEALSQSLATLNSTFDQDALFAYLLDTIDEIIPHRAANIMLVNNETMQAQVVRLRGYPNADYVLNQVVDVKRMPDKLQVLSEGKHFIIDDTRTYKHWLNDPEFSWIRSHLSVPITLEQGVIGFLNLDSEHPNSFTLQHAEWLMAFANQAALALHNARLMDQIRHYAADLERIAQARTAQLRAVLGSIRDGLIYHNLDQEAQYLNRALVEMLGYSSAEWMSGKLDYRQLIDGDEESVRRQVERIDQLVRLRDYVQEEARLRCKDGSTLSALLTRVIVRDEDGSPLGVLTLIRDISEEKALQEQRERFIANASHELRTPIANIKTRLYLMMRKPESIPENLEIIVKVTNWMQRLVDDMFDLSRFQRGLIELEREPVDIRGLLRDVLVFQQPEAERKDILLALKAPTEPVIVSVDPYRIMQVFSNLVSNALHHTPMEGRVVVEVSLSAAAPREVIITVKDTGSGIAEEHLEHLFKPFYRGTTESRGAGLGLTIAQEIVSLHGGRIIVESAPGMGSCFTVRLPVEIPETAAASS